MNEASKTAMANHLIRQNQERVASDVYASAGGLACEWRVHTSLLLEEIAKHSQQPALVKPIQILGRILAMVGQRASELHDRQLDALMMRLTIYTVADPLSPDYDPDLVSEYLRPMQLEVKP